LFCENIIFFCQQNYYLFFVRFHKTTKYWNVRVKKANAKKQANSIVNLKSISFINIGVSFNYIACIDELSSAKQAN